MSQHDYFASHFGSIGPTDEILLIKKIVIEFYIFEEIPRLVTLGTPFFQRGIRSFRFQWFRGVNEVNGDIVIFGAYQNLAAIAEFTEK